MSTTEVQPPIKIDNGKTIPDVAKEAERHYQRRATLTAGFPLTKKNKNENDGRFKFSRKRTQSFCAGTGKFFPPHKRRKKEGIIPPTKFLLGGNIYDPLNLNSLQDEEINRAVNAVTPKSSPLPTPKHRKGEVEVIIPPNINDPLNLIDCDDDTKYEQQLVSPVKKTRKSRHKKKKRNSSSGGSTKEDAVDFPSTEDLVASFVDDEKEETDKDTSEEAPAIVKRLSFDGEEDKEVVNTNGVVVKKPRKSLEDGSKESKHDKRIRKLDQDKIVSPVVPQPGSWKRPPHGYSAVPTGRHSRYRSGESRQKGPQQTPKFQEKNSRFQYGNYVRYYGYRNPAHEVDPRLKYLAERKEIFYDRDVLDIGCNIGHLTLIVARDFDAKSVVGLDIDRYLIDIARKNIRHYVNCSESPPTTESGCSTRFFPVSMPILFGDVDIRGFNFGESPSVRKKFPYNVTFVQGNYVLEADSLVTTEVPQFDVILCLSITKWIHLNWGDAGLKRAFKRMFAQLRPGGKLILEVQAWDSYKRKKKLTETIFRNYNSIKFLPHTFTQYLLSSEVGFSTCEVIATPYHQSRGFQRPIQLFTKSGISSIRSAPSATNTPSYSASVVGSNRDKPQAPVYTAVLGSIRESDEDAGTAETAGQKKHTVKMDVPTDLPVSSIDTAFPMVDENISVLDGKQADSHSSSGVMSPSRNLQMDAEPSDGPSCSDVDVKQVDPQSSSGEMSPERILQMDAEPSVGPSQTDLDTEQTKSNSSSDRSVHQDTDLSVGPSPSDLSERRTSTDDKIAAELTVELERKGSGDERSEKESYS